MCKISELALKMFSHNLKYTAMKKNFILPSVYPYPFCFAGVLLWFPRCVEKWCRFPLLCILSLSLFVSYSLGVSLTHTLFHCTAAGLSLNLGGCKQG